MEISLSARNDVFLMRWIKLSSAKGNGIPVKMNKNVAYVVYRHGYNDDDDDKKNAPWLSVPQFGDWDQKGVLPDYSLDFSKIRETRKQNKRDVSRASLGNEEELITPTTTNVNTSHKDHHNFHQDHSPTRRRSIFSYFNCCVKA
ncbi:hypothetical protein F0562_005604 [Nyssa sinensis]|uniref:RIN4 pathogenic type III effector avirulence factor Avr cleavage site domain-containing protein n=1 Tax=Nyssa sinensis TaxID=561372 RepID=A0A5J5AND6_9ASTE|nr:hypothetical protein F0562_005604 [Nyssa sinensis]